MSTTTTEAPPQALLAHDVQALDRHAAECRKTLHALALAGLEDSDRAHALRAEVKACRARLAENRRARQAQESEEWERQEDRERRREARAEQEKRERAEAVEWLAPKLAGGPVRHSEISAEAEAAGIGAVALQAAASELEVFECRRYGTGGRIRHGDPAYWTRTQLRAGFGGFRPL